MRVLLTFTEPLLGTRSGNPELTEEYIVNKRPDGPAADELETLPVGEELTKTSTLFTRNKNDEPILWDYQIKGFFKDACSMLRRVKGTRSSKIRAYRKIIDGLIFVTPRQIPIVLAGEIEWLERPLRVTTAQGERVALARSEMIPIDSAIEIDISVLDKQLEKPVVEWLEYGRLRGLGQWRNASYGRFEFESLSEK